MKTKLLNLTFQIESYFLSLWDKIGKLPVLPVVKPTLAEERQQLWDYRCCLLEGLEEGEIDYPEFEKEYNKARQRIQDIDRILKEPIIY